MLKPKKIIIVALVLATILSNSIMGQAASANPYERGYSIKGYSSNRGYSLDLLLNNYNNKYQNWQIINLNAREDIYKNIYDNIITIPSKPSQPTIPVIPEEPTIPELPVVPELPVLPEKPVVPEVPVAPEKPVIPEQPQQPPVASNNLSAQESEVVRLVNIERAKAGLEAFTISNKLSDVARLKSKDMADNRYFSHQSPTYGSPFEMMKQFGISYRTAGENIAKGYLTAQSVVSGWMNSSGHRANILNPSFKTIGVGAYKTSNNTIYWTQMFTN